MIKNVVRLLKNNGREQFEVFHIFYFEKKYRSFETKEIHKKVISKWRVVNLNYILPRRIRNVVFRVSLPQEVGSKVFLYLL